MKNGNKYFMLLLIMILSTFQFTCSKQTSKEYLSKDFPNILNVKNIPQQEVDWSAFCFSDKGSWFGFALPPDNSANYRGSFVGPFLMSNGSWLSQNLIGFKLYDFERKKEIDFAAASGCDINYYPGLLRQKLDVDGLKIQLDLWFVTNQTAFIRAMIFNNSTTLKTIRVFWEGSVFNKNAKFEIAEDEIQLKLEDGQLVVMRPINNSAFTNDYSVEKNKYKVEKKQVNLNSGQKIHTYFVFSMFEKPEDVFEESKKIQAKIREPEKVYEANLTRWNTYLNKVLNVESIWAKQKKYRNIAVKSLLTLMNNWRKASGDLFHDGLFPSYAIHYFNGFWAWDSWKHAAALARFEPELAKDQIRAMFDYQNESGMVADCIFADSLENNWRNTKPPLSGWAVWNVFKNSSDTLFLKEMFPKLEKYHRWWYQYRDFDQNGLCEYGSTDGSLVAAAWESGMDNAVRFDESEMVKNSESSWSLNQESVDLNSYLYAEKQYLARIALAIGKPKEADEFSGQAEELKEIIQEKMFDAETGYFYDINLETKEFVKIQGPEGWIPLWAKVATQEQAEHVKKVLMDKNKFATYIPFPTVARDHEKFSDGYWRGLVWLDQVCFAIQGLRNYGFEKEADDFVKQVFDRLQGLKDSDAPIRENYSPLTGEGRNVNHFSWSAAFLLMLYWGA